MWAALKCAVVLALAGFNAVASAADCSEPSWCQTSPSTKPLANGDENPKCGRWARECQCACPKALAQLEEEERAARLAEEERKARLAARDSGIRTRLLENRASNSQSSLAISIVVRTQNTPSDLKRVAYFQELASQHEGTIEFLFLHELEGASSGSPSGFWAITPFVHHWLREYTSLPDGGAQWFAVIEPWTDVNIQDLQGLLSYFDSQDNHFFGRALTMRSGVLTLSHDFRDLEFAWADSGLVISRAVIETLVDNVDQLRQNFFVTWEHEFANAVRKVTDTSIVSLEAHFCDGHADGDVGEFCATTALNKYQFHPSYGIKYEDIVIAVKTTVSYHAERLDILQNTWAKNRTHPVEIIFASDGPDDECVASPMTVA